MSSLAADLAAIDRLLGPAIIARSLGRPPFLHRLDLIVGDGDFTVIMGDPADAASALLNTLSGRERSDEGSVIFRGTSITTLDDRELTRFRRRHCGLVYREMDLIDGMSVADNLVTVGLMGDEDRSTVAARVADVLAMIGFAPDRADEIPSQLTAGEAQRVSLARVLMANPTVIFADHPTAGLDAAESAELLDCLARLSAAGASIVVATDDPLVAEWGDRIVYLGHGRVDGELDLPFCLDPDVRRQRLVDFLSIRGGGDR